MTIATPETKCYCNVLAMQKGLDPAGYATDFDDAILVEIPLPWKRNIYQRVGALPQEAVDLLQLWLKQYEAGGGYRHGALMIAPDSRYSRTGMRRVMYYRRPARAFAQFAKTEYLVPEAELGKLIWALYEAREDLPRFEAYRVPEHDATRDLLVCTHGTVDAACAKFGYPLYNYLRKNHASSHLRVWRVSHFGGHVFAPTMMDMPVGHYWAYVEREQAERIAQYSGEVSELRGHYRGWAGAAHGFMQAAEREMWQREGWAWFTYDKCGRVVAQDADEEDPRWSEVSIEFVTPDGERGGVYEARVEVGQHIETISTTGYAEAYPYPQYRVTRLVKQKG